ncbi:hypothetical protein VKT23_009444 [Stygiomarasmius scandens]|uniref:Uncharacterized protein n=1 Tax=Marasmiellus scandens TaxID=2682957 RepID=A0ABR1JG64_9AGAR
MNPTSHRRSQSPRELRLHHSPSLPPPFEEEGIPPLVFSDEEDDLRRHRELRPLPPVRERQGLRPAHDNLFIGAAKQQQYLESSDIDTPTGEHEYGNANDPIYTQQVHYSVPRRLIYSSDGYYSHLHSYSRAPPTLVQSKPFDPGMCVPLRPTLVSTKNGPAPPSMNPDSQHWSHQPPASHFNVQHPKLMPQRPDLARRHDRYQPMAQMYSAEPTSESRYTDYGANTGAGHSQHVESLKRLREEEEGSSLKCLHGKEEGSTLRPAKKRITGKAFKDLLLKQRTK